MGQITVNHPQFGYESIELTTEITDLSDAVNEFFQRKGHSTPDLDNLAVRLGGVVQTSLDGIPLRDQDSVLIVSKELNSGGIKGA